MMSSWYCKPAHHMCKIVAVFMMNKLNKEFRTINFTGDWGNKGEKMID